MPSSKTGSPTPFNPMVRERQIQFFVGGTALLACAAAFAVWQLRLPFPGWWPLATFVFVASLLESFDTRLRIAADGSTSFIIHMATALLFGGWWGAVVAAITTLLGEIVRNKPPIKVTF